MFNKDKDSDNTDLNIPDLPDDIEALREKKELEKAPPGKSNDNSNK